MLNHSSHLRSFCLSVGIALTATSAHASVRYVRSDAPPGGDGQSWSSAYNDLAVALAAAAASGGVVTEVWVKEGIYLPAPAGSTDRAANFTLVDEVGLYGGFAGTELSRDDRDPSVHTTTLSGNLGTVRAFNVVVGAGGPATVLDGFVITGGSASTGLDGTTHWAGGGVHIVGSPLIRNCVITGNNSGSLGFDANVKKGGGVYCAPGSAARLVDCRIELNITNDSFFGSAGAGGGLAAVECSVQLLRCIINSNSTGRGKFIGCGGGLPMGGATGGSGGGLYFDRAAALLESCTISGNLTGSADEPPSCGATSADGRDAGDGAGLCATSSAVVAVNCEFTTNRASDGGRGGTKYGFGFDGGAGGDGGGVYVDGDSIVELANCTLSDNRFGEGGPPGYGQVTAGHPGPTGVGAGVAGTAAVRLDNCIVWDGGESELAGGVVARFSNIDGGYSGTGNISADPRFADGSASDYRLHFSSPCIDAGDSTIDIDPSAGGVQSLPPADRSGAPRLVDVKSVVDTGVGAPVVDMGAHEFQDTACRADFNGDGLVDFSDYLEFLNLYDADDPRADLNGDGIIDFSDYLEFLNHYDAGC